MTSLVVPTAAQLLAEIEPLIVRVRHFRIGKIDRFGKVVGLVEHPPDRLPSERQDHHYDAMGRVLLLEKFLQGVSRPSRRLYRYEDWQVRDSLWVDPDGVVENYHRYSYDIGTSSLIWRAEYDATGKLFYSIRSTYGPTGQLATEEWFDALDRPVRKLAYTFDPNGFLASEARFDAAGQPAGSLRFKYDDQGNLLERAWHGPDGERRSLLRYDLDDRGRVVQVESRGADDVLQTVQRFEYDETGNVVAETMSDGAGRFLRQFGADQTSTS